MQHAAYHAPLLTYHQTIWHVRKRRNFTWNSLVSIGIGKKKISRSKRSLKQDVVRTIRDIKKSLIFVWYLIMATSSWKKDTKRILLLLEHASQNCCIIRRHQEALMSWCHVCCSLNLSSVRAATVALQIKNLFNWCNEKVPKWNELIEHIIISSKLVVINSDYILGSVRTRRAVPLK